MATFYATDVALTTISCGECGGTYAINERYRRQKQEEAGTWHCPYCECSWGYVKSAVQKLREEVQKAEQRLVAERQQHDQTKSALEHTERRRRAEKGQRTKMAKRIAKGVCPCCDQEFADLHSHMVESHPEFSDASEVDAAETEQKASNPQ